MKLSYQFQSEHSAIACNMNADRGLGTIHYAVVACGDAGHSIRMDTLGCLVTALGSRFPVRVDSFSFSLNLDNR